MKHIELYGKHKGEPLTCTLYITDWINGKRATRETPEGVPVMTCWHVTGISKKNQELYLDQIVKEVHDLFKTMISTIGDPEKDYDDPSEGYDRYEPD